MRAALADRLHARLGAVVFSGAVADIAEGRVRRTRLSPLTVLDAEAEAIQSGPHPKPGQDPHH